MALAAVLLVVAGVFFLFWHAPRPVAAQVVTDEKGHELVELTCDNCEDGTTVRVGSAVTTFTAARAKLSPPVPLRVGRNELDIEIERPGFGRDEKLSVLIPLEYRIKGDLSALSDDHPKLRIAAEATPGTAVVVDGHALALDGNGKAIHELDVSNELEGTADAVVALKRSVPYTVTPRDGQAQSGRVSLELGIAPLRIDAPGRRIIIESEHFMLTGQTLKDGNIAVEGRSITVDGAGRFAQLMNVSTIGATTITIRASAKDHAPRFARVEVKRVASLKEEARALRENAVREYSRIAGNIEAHKGAQVALMGTVVESRVDNHVTVALIEVESGCEQQPCLARLVHGMTAQLAPQQKLTVFGEVTRAVDGPRSGLRIPEVAAAFLLNETSR